MTPLSPPPVWIESTQKSAEERLAQLLERVQIPNLEPLRVLSEPSLPLRFRAEHFSEEARQLGASLIFIATRSLPAPRRWLQGSFTEALVTRSEIPVLSINNHWDRATQFESFTFVTDFSSASLAGLEQLLPWISNLNAKLTLYHLLQSGPSGETPVAPSKTTQERWLALASQAGDHRLPIERKAEA